MAIIVNKEEKRRTIALASKNLLLEHGIKNITISKIAECAGVGKGTIYEYFSNKEGLYKFALYKVPAGSITTTLSGTLSDIFPNESVLQVSTDLSEDFSLVSGSARFLYSDPVGIGSSGSGASSSTLDFKELGLEAHPDEELILTILSDVQGANNTNTVTWSIAYKDLF